MFQSILSVSSKNKDLFDFMVKQYEAQAQALDLIKDVDGRFHAPKGGIEFEGLFYIGGQFVPFDYNAPQGSRSKAIIEANDFENIKNSLVGCSEISHGKTWQRDNKTFTYIYFSAFRAFEIVDAINLHYKNKPQELKKGNSPEGKMKVTCLVINLSVELGFYGPIAKMLVEFEDGSRAFGTAPKGKYSVGDKITFKADFEKKDDSFSFFKRPTIIKQ